MMDLKDAIVRKLKVGERVTGYILRIKVGGLWDINYWDGLEIGEVCECFAINSSYKPELPGPNLEEGEWYLVERLDDGGQFVRKYNGPFRLTETTCDMLGGLPDDYRFLKKVKFEDIE